MLVFLFVSGKITIFAKQLYMNMPTTEISIQDYYNSMSDYFKECFDNCKAKAEAFFVDIL